MSYQSERVNAIRASWASPPSASLRAKKREKEGICEVECLAGTSGRQDTSSTVLIAANACGMQRPSVSPRHSHVIMPPFVAAIVLSLLRNLCAPLAAKPRIDCGYAYCPAGASLCTCVCVCLCVCLHATDSPLDTRVCKCSNIQVIVPAIRKSSSLIWQLSHLSYFFEIRNKMFIMLPEFFAPRWGT